MIRYWPYARHVNVEPKGASDIRGYGKYYDLGVLEGGVWRIHERAVHTYSFKLTSSGRD